MEEIRRKGAIVIQTKTKRQLAQEYNVHPNTMRIMCVRVGITHRNALSVKEVIQMYEHYGMPGEFEAI